MRLESNAAIVQFAIKTLDMRLEKRALDLEGKITDPHVQQMLVRQTIPGKTVAHAAGTSLETRVFMLRSLCVGKAFGGSGATGMGAAATGPSDSGSGNGAIVATLLRMR